MSQLTRPALVALLNSKVLSGGNQTTAKNLRDTFNAIIESMIDIIDDKDAIGGYLGINANGIVDITKIKKVVATGQFLRDDGTWQTITSGTDTEETFTVTGTTQALSNTPSFIYGVYMNGQRLTLAIDYTITTNTITFTNAMASDSITVSYKY